MKRRRQKRDKANYKAGRKILPIKFKKESDLPAMAASLSDMRHNKTGSWRSIKPVIDYTKCISCMVCWKYCPDACIFIKNGKPHIELDYCKGCGICIEECPVKAIKAVGEEK